MLGGLAASLAGGLQLQHASGRTVRARYEHDGRSTEVSIPCELEQVEVDLDPDALPLVETVQEPGS